MKAKCHQCHKEFDVKPWIIKQGKGKFCSRKCREIFQSDKKENRPGWKGGPVKRICETCGKEFKIWSCIVKRGGGRFCSRKCNPQMFAKERSPFWRRVRKT